MNLKVQTNIEVGLDLNENLYQWFDFIFPDFHQKSELILKLKLFFFSKKNKIKELKNLNLNNNDYILTSNNYKKFTFYFSKLINWLIPTFQLLP